MSDKLDLDDQILKEKIKTLLDEEVDVKKWNEGLLIKSLILCPIIIFLIGIIIINKPQNLTDLLFVFLYPLSLVSIGLILLFVMRSNLK